MATQTKTRELRIENPSRDLLFIMARDIPLPPYKGELVFLANGIKHPKSENREDNIRYYAECAEAGVIPNSGLTLEYDCFSKSFKYKDRFVESNPDVLYETRIRTLESVFAGNRDHKVTIELKAELHEKLQYYELLNLLISNNYHLYQGNFSFKTSPYSLKLIVPETRIEFELEKELKLNIGKDTSQKDRDKLTEWFNGLKKSVG